MTRLVLLLPLMVAGLAVPPAAASDPVVAWAPSDQGAWVAYVQQVSQPAEAARWLFTPSNQTAPRLLQPQPAWELWIAGGPDRTAVKLLTSPDPIGSLAWHPTGRHLAFLRAHRGDGPRRVELVVLDRPTREHRLLERTLPAELASRTSPESLVRQGVEWHPHGDQIAASMGERLILWDVRDKRERHAIDNAQFPRFSPDGGQLAYCISESGRRGLYFTSSIDGSGRQDLGRTVLAAAVPVWLDNQRVGSWSIESDTLGGGRRLQFVFNLRVEDRPPTAAVRVSPTLPSEGEHVPRPPVSHAWANDRLTVSLAGGILGAGSLWTMDVERPEAMRRWHPLHPELPVAVVSGAPDGQWIALRLGRFDATGGVLVARTAGTGRTGAESHVVAGSPSQRLAACQHLAEACHRLLLRVGEPPPEINIGPQPNRPATPPSPAGPITRLPGPGVFERLRGTPSRDDRPGVADVLRLANVAERLLEDPQPLTLGAAHELRFFVAFLREDWSTARATLTELGRQPRTPDERLACLYLLARVRHAQGRQAEALIQLDRLERQLLDTPEDERPAAPRRWTEAINTLRAACSPGWFTP